MTDEETGLSGTRLRTWDTCMASHFTLETSGHNPRAQKLMRWRNRAGHKFWYHSDLFKGAVACTGCGRCIFFCPSGVDIRAIILEAAKHAPAAQKESKNG
jgi:Fe-S oxidoreductase